MGTAASDMSKAKTLRLYSCREKTEEGRDEKKRELKKKRREMENKWKEVKGGRATRSGVFVL